MNTIGKSAENTIGADTPVYKLHQLLIYMLQLGTWGFGGPVALVGYMHRDLVERRRWISDADCKEGLALAQLAPGPLAAQLAVYLGYVHYRILGATLVGVTFVLPSFFMVVAMITPGPVVITVGFIGYLIAGFPGACVAALGTFLPCYLLTILPAPYFKKYGKLPAIVAFVDGVTAAAIGAIAGAVIVLAQRSLTDIPTVMLAVVTAALLWKFKKLPEPVIVLGGAAVGLVLYPLLHQ